MMPVTPLPALLPVMKLVFLFLGLPYFFFFSKYWS